MQAIKSALNKKYSGLKIDTEKIKQDISEKMTDELINRIVPYKRETLRLKITSALKCNSE